jgi:TolA-binding protein
MTQINEQQINQLFDQLRHLQHDVNSMRQELKNSQDKNNALEASVERLVYLLEGDKVDKDRGFISRLIALEKFSASVKDTKAYLMGNIAAAVFIITALGGIVGLLFKLYSFLKGQ